VRSAGSARSLPAGSLPAGSVQAGSVYRRGMRRFDLALVAPSVVQESRACVV